MREREIGQGQESFSAGRGHDSRQHGEFDIQDRWCVKDWGTGSEDSWPG